MKRVISAACILVLTAWTASSVFAASAKCTIVKVEGTQMVLDCGEKTKKFNEGVKIKIKSEKKAAVEGC